MSKSHRDNHKARKKRGTVAFEKKAERRQPVPKCKICGTVSRSKVLVDSMCPICRQRLGIGANAE